jgi:sarcosine oxidase, subunit gamma
MLEFLLDPCSIIRVQTWHCGAPVPSTAEEVLGTKWPRQTGTVASGRGDIVCIGPTDWLVIASDPDASALPQRLDEAFAGSPFRATDLSQALIRISIEGPEARVLLAKGCALDLHPSRFAPGRCARTRFASMAVIVRCMRDFAFECIVTRSYAEYLESWLTDAALEFAAAP